MQFEVVRLSQTSQLPVSSTPAENKIKGSSLQLKIKLKDQAYIVVTLLLQYKKLYVQYYIDSAVFR